MSNFPEKENLTEQEIAQSVKNEELEQENSTIFSDPTTHNDKGGKKGKKKLLPKLLAGILSVVILLGGVVAAIILIPEEEESNPFPEISVLNMLADDFKSVSLTNENGTFNLYVEGETQVNEETQENEIVYNWYLKEYAKDLIDSSAVKAVVETLAKINATREITTKTVQDCGLDKPSVKANILKKNGESLEISLGLDSPDNTGAYLKLSNSDKIYLVSKDFAQTVKFDAVSLATTDNIPGVPTDKISSNYKDGSGALSTFDQITISGKNFPQKVVFAPNTHKIFKNYSDNMVVSPLNRPAENAVTSIIFDLFKNGAVCTGAYAFEVNADTVKKVGLDNPDFTASIKLGNQNFSYSFKLQEDGNYAVIYSGCKLIKKVGSEMAEFAEYKLESIYSLWTFPQSLIEFKNLTLSTKEKTYSFDIVYNEEADAEETFVITHNGKKIDAQNFQTFYAYCTLLNCTDYKTTNVTGGADIRVTLTYSDTSLGKSVVEFRKSDTNKYQCNLNGIDMGTINSSAINKLLKYVEKVSKGQSIN